MVLSIGNKVKFINEALTGVITKIISENELEIRDNYGFIQIVTLADVVVINENDEAIYSINKPAFLLPKNLPKNNLKSSFLDRYRNNSTFKYERTLEIDLHLEELVEFPTRLDDWQKLHTQLNHAKKCIEAAQREKIKRLIFIHGKGTGVLKTELRNLVSNTYQLRFADADYRRYDTGATEVFL